MTRRVARARYKCINESETVRVRSGIVQMRRSKMPFYSIYAEVIRRLTACMYIPTGGPK